MRVTDRVSDDVETLLANMPHGDDFTWDIQVGLMPDQAGNNIVIAQFFVFGRNPILGQGDLAVVEILPLEMTKHLNVLEAMLRRCIEQIREQQSNTLR